MELTLILIAFALGAWLLFAIAEIRILKAKNYQLKKELELLKNKK